jgi:hypothetical protein
MKGALLTKLDVFKLNFHFIALKILKIRIKNQHSSKNGQSNGRNLSEHQVVLTTDIETKKQKRYDATEHTGRNGQ